MVPWDVAIAPDASYLVVTYQCMQREGDIYVHIYTLSDDGVSLYAGSLLN